MKKYNQAEILASVDRIIPAEAAMEGEYPIIDVRSPGEYEGGTIPGAVNVPIFDEDERSLVGTIYRHQGKDIAINRGFEVVEQKIVDLLETLEPYRKKPLAVFCARGGMRSRSMVNLLNRSGFSAFQIEGGYKKYRAAVLNVLHELQPGLIVIHGFTGTGKTRILQYLSPAIDLEGLAGHRSSLFGAIGLNPVNQRTFESGLARVVSGLGLQPWFIEGESRKIGRVFIPKPLAKAMKEATLVQVHCSIETRITQIIDDYQIEDSTTLHQVEKILRSLRQKLGGELVEEMCRLLRENRLRDLVRILLLEYYDKRYSRSMRDYRYDLELSSENIEEAAAELQRFRESLL